MSRILERLALATATTNASSTGTGRSFICSICGTVGYGWDNNAWPINMSRCCHDCNFGRVLPARIELMRKQEEEAAAAAKLVAAL